MAYDLEMVEAELRKQFDHLENFNHPDASVRAQVRAREINIQACLWIMREQNAGTDIGTIVQAAVSLTASMWMNIIQVFPEASKPSVQAKMLIELADMLEGDTYSTQEVANANFDKAKAGHA